MKLKRKHILPILGVIFILMQFFRIDKTNPPIDLEMDFIATEKPPEAIAQKLVDACYDCHSHDTEYPWYTNIAPVSWWVKGHINNGRQNLNFSKWTEYSEKKQAHKIEENIEKLENRWMPLSSFVWLHPEAKMSDSENEEMIAYFKSLQ